MPKQSQSKKHSVYLISDTVAEEQFVSYMHQATQMMRTINLDKAVTVGFSKTEATKAKKALTLFKKAAAIHHVTDQAMAWYFIGYLYYGLSKYKLAYAGFKKSAVCDPTIVEVQNELANLALLLSKPAEAAGFAKVALRLDPKQVSLYLSYAQALILAKKLSDALAVIKQAHKKFPRNREVKRMLQYIQDVKSKKIIQPKKLADFEKSFIK